jgi:outer membrane protein OmpA-like peptidoglycan-associated protein
MRGAREVVFLGVIGALYTGCATVDVELITLQGAKISAGEPAPLPVVAEEKSEPAAVQISDNKITIDEKIQFETWSAQLLEDSHGILDEVAKVLSENEQIKRVEIQGHTARTGQSKRSQKLSVDRANAVRAYLVKKGVAQARLVAKGYGESKPVADNSSADGREQNRRVEFVIISSSKGEVALAQDRNVSEEAAQ